MLHEFLTANQDELARRCRAKSAARTKSSPASDDTLYGVPWFIDQLVEALRADAAGVRATEGPDRTTKTTSIAAKHGHELLLKGFTIDQVIHDYGDLCQALTELAAEKHEPISVDEFHTFNRCLDNATADAVTEFTRERDHGVAHASAATTNERLGALAHELRNHLNAATLAYGAMKSGSVATAGATGGVLERSLHSLRGLIDRSLADVRLTAGMQLRREPISVEELVSDVRTAAVLEAFAKGIAFSSSVERGLTVEADRQMLASAVANLLQNALKFTPRAGAVSLAARSVEDRVVISVTDACGGLPDGQTEILFVPFEQRGADRTGLGLGLSISRRAVEANGGTLIARDLPGVGCVFVIDLPRGV